MCGVPPFLPLSIPCPFPAKTKSTLSALPVEKTSAMESLTNALDTMLRPDAVIQVKGSCKICGQSVWNNEERFKTCGEDGVYEVCDPPPLTMHERFVPPHSTLTWAVASRASTAPCLPALCVAGLCAHGLP